MLDLPSLAAFVAAAAVLTVTPGVDTAMVLRSAAAGGSRSAGFAALGIALGCLLWGVAVSLGLGALLEASEPAYAVVKWLGAGYLLWLGVRLLLKPRDGLAEEDAGGPRPVGGEALRRGLLTNLLNPKVGVFYVTFLPQFIPAGADVPLCSFALAAVHVGLTLAWFAVLIAAIAPLGRVLRRPGVVRILDRLTGGVFIAFGLKLAVSKA